MTNHDLGKLVQSKVVFGVSDPWDFYTEHGDQEYSAIVKAVSSELLLVELTVSLQYKGVVFKHLVATARHEDKSLADMTTSHAVPVNLVPAILQEKTADANTDDLFHAAASWRSWHLIGGLRLKSEKQP